MTLEIVDPERTPGYAGALQSQPHRCLADRFHFWRGASGRRYAFTRFPLNQAPSYENSISLFVRRRGQEISVLATSSAPGAPIVPLGADEIHVHLVQGGAEAVKQSLHDLQPLVAPPPAPCPLALRAA
jgi:hypothetical protein